MSISEGVDTSASEERALYVANARHDFKAGAALAVVGIAAIAFSFWQTGMQFWGPANSPRVLALAVVVTGIALLLNRVTIRNPQDFYGGVALVAVAVIALFATMSLQGMRGFAFGPATAPRLFATLLGALGGLVAIMGLVTPGPALERYAIRGPVFVLGAILIFAATIRPLGLIVAAFLTILSAAGAAPDVRWRETVVWAVILTAFCSVLFPYGLSLPFQLMPRFWY